MTIKPSKQEVNKQEFLWVQSMDIHKTRHPHWGVILLKLASIGAVTN